MMSSSEIQRISLSGTKIVTPTGHIELEDWESEEEKEEKIESEATTTLNAENSDAAADKHKGEEEKK